MTQMLTPVPAIFDLHRPTWLFARTFRMMKRTTALVMYKSTLLDDSDEWCEEVFSFIRNQRFEFAWKGMFFDGMMMFGEGELSFYLKPADGEEFDLDPELIEDLRAEGLRVVREHMGAA